MNIEKMREEFEAWILEKHPILMLLQEPRGGYIDGRTDAYWEVWQASRESMAIELPDIKVVEYDAGYTVLEQCRDAIRAAGVKTK